MPSVMDYEEVKTSFPRVFDFVSGANGTVVTIVRAGRPAIRTSRGLTGRFAELDCTAQDELPEKRKEILEFPPYCPVGQPDLGRGRATGFFHVEEDGEGRWWAVDPIGSRIFVRGVEQIKWKAFSSGPRGESRNFAVNREKYGTRQVWETATLKRLADWGFNALGCGRYPAEFTAGHDRANWTIAWTKPLSAIVTLYPNGRIRIDGAKAEFAYGLTPVQAGLPAHDACGRYTVPEIRSCDLTFNFRG